MEKREILLHTCCAPCIGHVHELLSASYDVISFYYNPNIHPVSEYQQRLREIEAYAKLKNFPLIEGEYDAREWFSRVKQYRFDGERSKRCWECYRIRLEKTFVTAREKGIPLIATVLSISPHKDASMLNEIGKELEEKYQIEFLEADFKKKDGFKKSVELSKKHGFYRQNYCGCVYSKFDRYKG